ncbi:MAG TPA: type VI secretion system tube protein Hcp [Steroidobacteraceae bacterium]|nr:type VI secretion system tube protein Hcp [Steroidobacteraceae bacterium]
MRKTVLSTVVISGILLAATASLAASDYYIKFDGVDGESKSGARAATIELQSWSFGASQAGVLAPRDSASGLATGKRMHKPKTVITSPAAGEIQTVTFAVPEPGDASTAQLARLCASGKPIKSAVLGGPDGRYQMNDVVVSSCAVKGNERRYELKGHVTLMK